MAGLFFAASAGAIAASLPAHADDLLPGAHVDPAPTPVTAFYDLFGPSHGASMHGDMGGHSTAPAGVLNAGMIGAGHFMFAYTPMFMHMDGNYIGSSQASTDTIATTAKLPMPMTMMGMTFTTYRIVPTSMDVQSHMVHAMYGVTDWLNIGVMGSYVDKSMTMLTYKGPTGTTVLGSTTNESSGFGDTMVTSIWRVYQDGTHHVQLHAGLSLPSGSTTETMSMLSPMGTLMQMRANYGMQLGSGTVDFLPGVTYTGHWQQWSWGVAYRGRVALDTNDQGYQYGYRQNITGWGGYSWIPGVTTTARVDSEVDDRIHGADPAISGLMQGTNPNYYGGEHVNLLGGLEISGEPFGLGHTRAAVEGGGSVYQHLNGPQLGQDWQINVALGIGF